MKRLTKKEAEKIFRRDYLPAIREYEKQYMKRGAADIALRFNEWSYFTDMLYEEGRITKAQNQSWLNLFG